MLKVLLTILLLSSSIVYGQNVKEYIPPQAFKYRDVIREEQLRYFTELHEPNYIPALIEHESCISLKHSKCWSSTSTLSTKRELGIGLGQITKTYNTDGSVRFDSLTNMRNTYRAALKEAKWETISQRPDIQIRIIVLMLMENWNQLHAVTDNDARLQMVDSGYNGGMSGVHNQRRLCSLTKGCNPNLWFGHVEKYSTKSTKILYGNRSARDINLHHVKDVFLTRLPKYKRNYFTKEYLDANKK